MPLERRRQYSLSLAVPTPMPRMRFKQAISFQGSISRQRALASCRAAVTVITSHQAAEERVRQTHALWLQLALDAFQFPKLHVHALHCMPRLSAAMLLGARGLKLGDGLRLTRQTPRPSHVASRRRLWPCR